MGTLKKFRIYLILFVAFFLFTGFLTYVAMKDNYKDLNNYEIKTDSPKIEVTESRATRTHGYIKGSVTNNTGEFMPLKYLQINLYDENDVYLGSEYKELKYFNINETIKFDISYRYNSVNKITLKITDEIAKNENNYFFNNVDDETLKLALPIARFMTLYAMMP